MPDIQAHETVFWKKDKLGRVSCRLCPRFCSMADGQRGMCFVRGNVNGEVKLLSYGRSSGFCLDPVEKKPLNHFLPGSSVLSFGTAGCNLACKFCQNHDISKSRQMDRLQSAASPQMIANAAAKSGAKSVAYTYNDPVIYYEYVLDVAKACKANGIRNIAVTAGYICQEPREAFFAALDATNIDLKSFREDFYFKLTGAHLAPVLETLEYVYHHTNCWLEITTLLIPGANDSEEEIRALSQWIGDYLSDDVPLHFSAFRPEFRMMDRPPTPIETLLRARDIAKQTGLKHVYIGNKHDKAAQSSYCPSCGNMVIGRDWYELSDWQLNDRGDCLHCGERMVGIFDGAPANWGRKSQPIKLGPPNY